MQDRSIASNNNKVMIFLLILTSLLAVLGWIEFAAYHISNVYDTKNRMAVFREGCNITLYVRTKDSIQKSMQL